MDSKELAQAIAKALHQKNGGGKPWWAKSIWVLGPVSVIALVLVAQNAGLIPSPFKEQHENIAKRLEQTNRILTIMCERSAENEWGKLACRSENINFATVDSPSLFPIARADDSGGNP